MFEFISNFHPLFKLPFWGYSFFGNPVSTYVEALLIFILLIIVFKIFQASILARLHRLAEKTKTDFDDVFIAAVNTIRHPFYFFIAFYLALFMLDLDSVVRQTLNAILIFWVVYQSIATLQILIDFGVKKTLKQEDSRDAQTAIQSLSLFSKIILWSLGLLLIISNLGFDVTSLIAGLGIGGVAVALAVQNILSDLFSSFAIYFDKPFKVGDFIVIGPDMGVVEKIGIKTTRLRALQGEEIVISNKELTSVRVQNFKKMEERRVAFTLGVTYDTPDFKLKKIPGLIEDIIKPLSHVSFDRAHFHRFGDSALIFEIVYYLASADYTEYMNVQQHLNLEIKAAFAKEKIEFAYPTQTIYLSGGSSLS